MEITNQKLHDHLMSIYSQIRDCGLSHKAPANWITYTKYPTDLQNFLKEEHSLEEYKNKFIALLSSKFIRIVPLTDEEKWNKVRSLYGRCKPYLDGDGKTWSWNTGSYGDTYELLSVLTSQIVDYNLTFDEISLIERCFKRAVMLFDKNTYYSQDNHDKYLDACGKLKVDYENLFNPIIEQYWELRASHPIKLYPAYDGSWKEWTGIGEWEPSDYSYHGTPRKVHDTWTFTPKAGIENMHFGIEKEMVFDNWETFADWVRYCIDNKILTEKWEFIWNQDCSLPNGGTDVDDLYEEDSVGREIITRPMTEAEYKEWAPKFEASLDKFGVDRTDDSCGCHIHIEKSFISDEDIVGKIVPNVMGHSNEWFEEKFGRAPNTYCRNGLDNFRMSNTSKEIVLTGKYVDGKWVQTEEVTYSNSANGIQQNERHCAVNLQHRGTVEFRALAPDTKLLDAIKIAKEIVLKDVKLLEAPRCRVETHQ